MLGSIAVWDLLGWGCRSPCLLPVVKEGISDPGNIPYLPVESAFCLPGSRASVGELGVSLAWEILQQRDMWDTQISGCFGHVSPKYWSSSEKRNYVASCFEVPVSLFS